MLFVFRSGGNVDFSKVPPRREAPSGYEGRRESSFVADEMISAVYGVLIISAATNEDSLLPTSPQARQSGAGWRGKNTFPGSPRGPKALSTDRQNGSKWCETTPWNPRGSHFEPAAGTSEIVAPCMRSRGGALETAKRRIQTPLLGGLKPLKPGQTLGRLWVDFGQTLGRLWVDFG